MGTKIFFYPEVKQMTTNVSEYFLIARCPDCNQIIRFEAVTPGMSEYDQASIKDGWRAEGLKPDTVTRRFFHAWYSSRGCTCSTKDAAK